MTNFNEEALPTRTLTFDEWFNSVTAGVASEEIKRIAAMAWNAALLKGKL